MQTLLTTEEIYSHAAADGARPDPLLTYRVGDPTEPYRSAPPPNPARGARTTPYARGHGLPLALIAC
jgi:hypothetical protein